MNQELEKALEDAKNARDKYDKLCCWEEADKAASDINDSTTSDARENKEIKLKKLIGLLQGEKLTQKQIDGFLKKEGLL